MQKLPRWIVKVYPKFRIVFKTGTAVTACSLLIFLNSCSFAQKQYNSVDFMMDTFVTQQWYGENSKKCYDEIYAMLSENEKLFSGYLEDSEIDSINKMSGKERVKISPLTFEVLLKSLEYSRQSEGKFDITIAPLVKLWDITGENPAVPMKNEIDKATELVNFQNLILNENDSTAFLSQQGMEIDIGGVLKGFLSQKALSIAQENKVTGYISLGGNMAVAGKKNKREDFKIGIRNPRGSSEDYMGIVTMPGMTMSTAGDYERFFIEDDVRYHHILDPFTGFPAETDLISVTVLSGDGLLADFLSTYIFMSGKDKLRSFFDGEGYEVLAVDKDLNVYGSDGFWEVFLPQYEKKEFNFINEQA